MNFLYKKKKKKKKKTEKTDQKITDFPKHFFNTL